MLSYFSRVGPRPESSGSFSSIAGFEKELPRTPVKDVLSSEDEDKKKNASPTQLRLEDLGTYPPEIPSLQLVSFCSSLSQSHLLTFLFLKFPSFNTFVSSADIQNENKQH